MNEQHGWDGQERYRELVRHWNEEKRLRDGRAPAAYTRTYGCQQNVSDGEKINGMLADMGFRITDREEEADLVLYNTCAIRENAENRVFGNVGALRNRKRGNPELIVALAGCMTQQDHIARHIRASFPFVDIVLGTHALPRLPELLYRRMAGEKRVFETESEDGVIIEGVPVRRDGRVRAWVPIMYGCDNFCTYCVVPLVRGRERSRDPALVLGEVRELVAAGYKDVTLLGQNVNSYRGNGGMVDFPELLRRITAIPGDFRVRFMTSHPKDCTRELIDVVADSPKLVNHIHLPVQSGSDRILAAMNRRYTVADYLALVRYAKQRIPGVAFTSDIIVGFPGEGEADFEATLELVREVGFQSLFTFLYSRRAGTKAAGMEDPTPVAVKKERFQRLLALQQEIGDGKHEELVGETIRVLADSEAKRGDGYMEGRGESNVIVEFKAPRESIGAFVNVTITEAHKSCVVGEIV